MELLDEREPSNASSLRLEVSDLGERAGMDSAVMVLGALATKAMPGGARAQRVVLVSPKEVQHHPVVEPLEWTAFLSQLEGPVGLDPRHAQAVRRAWNDLRAALGPKLPLPRAEGGDGGQLKFAWSGEKFYAGLEIHADDTHEWFYRDRHLDRADGTRGPARGAPAHAFLAFLKFATGA